MSALSSLLQRHECGTKHRNDNKNTDMRVDVSCVRPNAAVVNYALKTITL